MLLLLAALTAGFAVFLVVATLSAPPSAAMLERLAQRRREGITRLDPGQDPFMQRVGAPLLARLRRDVTRPLPARLRQDLGLRLQQAGDPIGVQAFAVWQAGMVVLGVAILGLGAPGAERTTLLLIALLALLLGLVPTVWLRARKQARINAMVRALPDAVDVIVTTVEAGLAVEAAIREVAAATPGPLGAELRHTMREITLGRGRREAFLALIERAPVPELKSFVHALLQAQDTGVPLGDVLRAQADEMRVRRRQRAEAAAGRAPVKMVVVLVLLVMPAMILFMMGPAALRFMQRF